MQSISICVEINFSLIASMIILLKSDFHLLKYVSFLKLESYGRNGRQPSTYQVEEGRLFHWS